MALRHMTELTCDAEGCEERVAGYMAPREVPAGWIMLAERGGPKTYCEKHRPSAEELRERMMASLRGPIAVEAPEEVTAPSEPPAPPPPAPAPRRRRAPRNE
jgi:hypothetical protein